MMESEASHGQAAQGGVGQAHLAAHPPVERDIAAAVEDLEEANSESSSIPGCGTGAGAGGRRGDMAAARARRAGAECSSSLRAASRRAGAESCARRVDGRLQVSKANAAQLDGGRHGVAEGEGAEEEEREEREAGFDEEAALQTDAGGQMCGARPSAVDEGFGGSKVWVHDFDRHDVESSDAKRASREQHEIMGEEDGVASASCGRAGSTASEADESWASADDWDGQLDLDAPD